MGKQIFFQIIVSLAFLSCLSATPQSRGTISRKIAAIESKSDMCKPDILDSVGKANIELLVSKTGRKIQNLETRLERYSKKLTLCKDTAKEERLLCKIKSTQERLKSYRELQGSLTQMKTSMSK